MADLHERLRALRDEVEWPPTPSLEVRVGEPARRRVPRRTLALAGVVGLLAVGGAGAAVVLRLDGATVERRDGPAPTGPAAPAEIDVGDPVPPARPPFDVLAPARAGRPDAVGLRDGIEVGLAYGPGPGRPRAGTTGLGLLVTEFRGDLHPAYVGKVAYQGTEVRRLRIDGRRALWVAGAPHFFFYRRPGRADVSERPLRLAANVLLVERGPLLVRLEGAFDRAEAVALARSLEPLG